MVVNVLDIIEFLSICDSWLKCACLQYIIDVMKKDEF